MKHKVKEHYQDDQTFIVNDTYTEDSEQTVLNCIENDNYNLVSMSLMCHKNMMEYISNQGYPLCEKLTPKQVIMFIEKLV